MENILTRVDPKAYSEEHQEGRTQEIMGTGKLGTWLLRFCTLLEREILILN